MSQTKTLRYKTTWCPCTSLPLSTSGLTSQPLPRFSQSLSHSAASGLESPLPRPLPQSPQDLLPTTRLPGVLHTAVPEESLQPNVHPYSHAQSSHPILIARSPPCITLLGRLPCCASPVPVLVPVPVPVLVLTLISFQAPQSLSFATLNFKTPSAPSAPISDFSDERVRCSRFGALGTGSC